MIHNTFCELCRVSSFGVLIGTAMMDFEKSITLLAVLGIFFMLFGGMLPFLHFLDQLSFVIMTVLHTHIHTYTHCQIGFMIKDRAMPVFVSWLKYTSTFRYTYLATMEYILIGVCVCI